MDWYGIGFFVLVVIWIGSSFFSWRTKNWDLFQAVGVFGVLVALLGVGPFRENNVGSVDEITEMKSEMEIHALKIQLSNSQLETLKEEAEWRITIAESVNLISRVLVEQAELKHDDRQIFRNELAKIDENLQKTSASVSEIEVSKKESEEEFQKIRENLDKAQAKSVGLVALATWLERLIIVISSIQWAFGRIIFRPSKVIGEE